MPVSESMNWDLEVIFPGGFSGSAWTEKLADVEAQVAGIVAEADALADPATDPNWDSVLPALEALSRTAGSLYAYAHCRISEDVADPDGNKAAARLAGVWARISRAWTNPEQRIARADEDTFAALCARPALAEQVPHFVDMRSSRHLLLPSGEQGLLAELSDPAVGAWSRLYDRLSGRLRATVDGEEMSVGQAANLLNSPDPSARSAAFEGMKGAWQPVLDDCADILGNLTQTRLVVSGRLGVDPIASPLAGHRMERSTLDSMLGFCRDDARPLMHRYIRAKARALGGDTLDYWDLRAPMGGDGTRWEWGRAQEFIIEQFATFSNEMAEFAQKSFMESWVEAEDRSGKRQGAFCIPFREFHQSRIFMTWSGTTTNLITLAHELGHAWHNEVMWDLPSARARVPSTLAESASTFAEAVVRGAALRQARGDEAAELALLESELQAAAVMLVNIPTRMLFEQALFDDRAGGPLDAAVLSERMESLQREWYGPALGVANRFFWSAKLHFFLQRPFYNYPYTFGYLFSSLIHAKAMAEG
ncbi:MAG: M3 family metallopeptidase, partial [Myxococcota bacterium]|nr:M3 family metallopeptidase [Myxococcota bacterium]